MEILRKSLLTGIIYSIASVAYADAGVMFGISYNFDGSASKNNLGLTLKVTSSDRESKGVVAAGVSFFPYAPKSWGIDAGIGYNGTNSVITLGYDFLNKLPQLGLGYLKTVPRRGATAALTPDPGEEEVEEEESDIRLKRDITLLVTLDDGMKIYSFKYLWSDVVFVGLMAQDLLAQPSWASAVSERSDGYYVVNYASLGYRMSTLEQWRESGLLSITRKLPALAHLLD